MSGVSLVDVTDLGLVSSGKVSMLNGALNGTNTQKLQSERTILMPLFMEILRRLILEQFRRSTSLSEDLHVKTSAMLVKELALRGVVLKTGRIMPKQLGFFDQSSQSLKTSQPSLSGDFLQFLKILPKSGMMRNGIIYQLPALERFTNVRESLSLPTLTVADSWNDKLKSSQQKEGSKHSLSLSRAVLMHPTPNSGMYRNLNYQIDKLQERSKKHQIDLAMKIQMESGGGSLNPNWCEWLMGFPIGWTELSVSEMQSFRKLRKLSHKQSKKSKSKGVN